MDRVRSCRGFASCPDGQTDSRTANSANHLALGVAGLAVARTFSSARTCLIGGGILYLVLWIYGMLIEKTSGANFVPLNTADDWLHFALGAGMVALGFALGKKDSRDEAFE